MQKAASQLFPLLIHKQVIHRINELSQPFKWAHTSLICELITILRRKYFSIVLKHKHVVDFKLDRLLQFIEVFQSKVEFVDGHLLILCYLSPNSNQHFFHAWSEHVAFRLNDLKNELQDSYKAYLNQSNDFISFINFNPFKKYLGNRIHIVSCLFLRQKRLYLIILTNKYQREVRLECI